jgi:hypothetical protein
MHSSHSIWEQIKKRKSISSSKHHLTRHCHVAILHVFANRHTKLLVGEKGHNQTLGKRGKRYPKASLYPVGEWERPACAVAAPVRYQKIDHNHHSRRMGCVLVNIAGAVAATFRY